MIAQRSIPLLPQGFNVQSPRVIEQGVPVPLNLLVLAHVAATCSFSPYPMDWKIETRLKGIGKKPKPKPMPKPKACPKPRAHPKNKLVGNELLSKILNDGKVARGACLEVYPKEGERARWFVRVVNGKLKWDEKGNPLISVIRWCKENTTELDTAFLPESCPLGWVMRRVR
jgi:hypothetical protein